MLEAEDGLQIDANQLRVDRLKAIGRERYSGRTPFENYNSFISHSERRGTKLTADEKRLYFQQEIDSWNKTHPKAPFNLDTSTSELFLNREYDNPFTRYYEFMKMSRLKQSNTEMNPAVAKQHWDEYVLEWNEENPDQKIEEVVGDWLVPFHGRYYLLEE